jgi:hypothetical protein
MRDRGRPLEQMGGSMARLKDRGRAGLRLPNRQHSSDMAAMAVFLGLGSAVLAQPAATTGGAGTPSAEAPQQVACLLPADIDRFGQQLTIAGARQKIETSRADCEARGGEVLDEHGPASESGESGR